MSRGGEKGLRARMRHTTEGAWQACALTGLWESNHRQGGGTVGVEP
jgi:hypothetical protein